MKCGIKVFFLKVKPDKIVIVTQARSVQIEGRDVGEEDVQVVFEVVDLVTIISTIFLVI